jgi:hypothetical protein
VSYNIINSESKSLNKKPKGIRRDKMTKLERMIKNGGTYTLSTNTLKKYYEDDLIDSYIVFSEIPSNKKVNVKIESNELKIWSNEINMPNGSCDIIDEKLLEYFKIDFISDNY